MAFSKDEPSSDGHAEIYSSASHSVQLQKSILIVMVFFVQDEKAFLLQAKGRAIF